jgi:hypothetical protein
METLWTREEYDSDRTRLRSTALKSLLKPQGPRAYWWDVVANVKPIGGSKAVRLGNLIHEYLLDGIVTWVVYDGIRNHTHSAYKTFLAANPGKVVLSKTEESELMGMIDGVARNKRALEMITGGFPEEIILWDHKTGIPCKSRLDIYDAAFIADIKTTRAETEEQFIREIYKFRYEVSAAFYEQARDFEVGRRIRAPFYFITICNQPPHYTYVLELGDGLLNAGHRQVDQACATLKECKDNYLQAMENGTDIMAAWPDWEELRQGTFKLTPHHFFYEDRGFTPEDI